jgi:hypothetical protein
MKTKFFKENLKIPINTQTHKNEKKKKGRRRRRRKKAEQLYQ